MSLLEREGHHVVAVSARQAAELPCDKRDFDTVLLGAFLGERLALERPISEARRVLRRRGRLIIVMPYSGDDRLSLDGLLGALADGFAVKDVTTIDGELCMLAQRGRERNRTAAWRAALGAVERTLSESDLSLTRARAELRDAEESVARLDRESAAAQRELETERAALAQTRSQLEARERELALAEQRLEQSRRRAEHLRSSLLAIRRSRAYRLMRVLWWLRRPFTRSAADPDSVEEATEDVAEEKASEPVRVRPEKQPARRRESGSPLVVASILDKMSEACFAPECDLVPLALDDWREQLDEHRPDLLLVESAWNGNGGNWQYQVAKYPRPDLAGLPVLRELVDACRAQAIPTAFWNKEDPIHFDRFVEAASLFDHVFTTDSRCVERYRDLPGERTVDPLPFAAQPRIHNPAAVVPERSASPCFAGAWYRDRHPERRRALEALLDAARPFGLVIYDRTFGTDSKEFGFPDRFAPHVLGRLPYEQVLDVYKGHRVFLNANSVVDSPTMCSRRVFELAACDTAILSTPGAALANLLGEGAVVESSDAEDAAEELDRLINDGRSRRTRVRAARRKVFAEHTYARRLAAIAEIAGLDAPIPLEDDWKLLARQGVTLTPAALADLEAATSFAGADVIGVHDGRGGEGVVEHRRVDSLNPSAVLVRRDLLRTRGHPEESADRLKGELERWSSEGVTFYAADADLLDLSAGDSAPAVA